MASRAAAHPGALRTADPLGSRNVRHTEVRYSGACVGHARDRRSVQAYSRRKALSGGETVRALLALEMCARELQLLSRGVRAVYRDEELPRARVRPAVPADVLARDAHAHVLAVELVQGLQVVEQDAAHLADRRLGQRLV